MKEHVLFLKEFLTRFRHTGAIAPTSKWAARKMTSPLRDTTRPQKILEIGSGTGSITAKILKDMIPGDSLTICEINPNMMKLLKEKLSSNEDYLKHKDSISFFEGPFQEYRGGGKFDVIICSIPFTNLSLKEVVEIFDKLQEVSNSNTRITFFEYIGLRKLSKIVSMKERRERIEQVDRFFNELEAKYKKTAEHVWLNITPITVYTLSAFAA